MTSRTTHCRRSPEQGFGLVEILVAMVIGLLSVAAIMAVFWSSEGQKRTITGGADASENGLIALATMERELRVAGMGLVELSCPTVNGMNGKTGETFSFTPLPAVITREASPSKADLLEIVYSASPFGNLATELVSPMLTPDAPLELSNGEGIRQGDLILISEGTKPCSIVQASADSVRPDFHWSVTHAPGDNFPFNNPPAASFPGYTPTARVINMGGMGRRQYFVDGAKLMLLDLNLPVSTVAPVNPVMVADGIISIRAQYGKDTNNDGYINQYDNDPPANPREVVAIRLAVVARSVQLEKTAVSPATLELWNGGTTTNGGAIALTPEDQLYRYKVYQTTVPLRNVIWGN